MADRTWKAFERRAAAMFGTRRIPAAGCMGHQQKDASDFRTGLFSFQAKKGYDPPGYLKTWLDGIVGVAKGEARFGVVLWAGKRTRDDDAFVVMRAADFAEVVAELEKTKGTASTEPYQPCDFEHLSTAGDKIRRSR